MNQLRVTSFFRGLQQNDSCRCGFFGLAEMKITLDWLETISTEEFENMSFDDFYEKLTKEIILKLTHASVEEIMRIYKNFGIEKLLNLRASIEMKPNREVMNAVISEDVTKRFPDGLSLNENLKKMGYPLRERGYRGEMDFFWKLTRLDAILTEPIVLDGNLKCPSDGCPFISTRSKITKHLVQKHPQNLKYYFDFPRLVLPFIARDEKSIVSLFKNYDSFERSEIKSIHISQVIYGYFCPIIKSRYVSSNYVDNIMCDERKIAHQYIRAIKNKREKKTLLTNG